MLNSKFGDYLAFVRRKMLEDQIAARGVRDGLVLETMEKVERHLFVDEYLRNRAYEDCPLPIAEGQTISQPYIVALMTECLALKGGEKVLEIGTGSGYQTAVLAELAKEVFTVEYYPVLAEKAKAALKGRGYDNIKFKTGDGHEGWKEYAPYDAIMVTCAPKELPAALLEQLAGGGRLAAPVGGQEQTLALYTRTASGLEKSDITRVRFVPMIAAGTTGE
ncbi:MAG: protein-L-isoaspartate(D-aspartate) O-methyltransferase [Proteobacteria bacterium]|nr:protein-L-isoaspartate(D-aspartate) O-methyltransferase [Pseudomonadota bacterium]MBU2573308.1 protein-L-isoaspartate(D-aspartate) O-methyltransferase [Elusimicrobiota bacterium]